MNSKNSLELNSIVPSRNERSFLLFRSDECSDHEQAEEHQGRTEGELPLIDSVMFYDLLMEQQEQM